MQKSGRDWAGFLATIAGSLGPDAEPHGLLAIPEDDRTCDLVTWSEAEPLPESNIRVQVTGMDRADLIDLKDPADLTPLIARLAEHKTLGGVPREELAWLAKNGILHKLETGGVLERKGVPVEWLHVVLTGHLVLFVDRGSGPQKAIEWRAGEVSGILPYSRLGSPPGDAVAQEPMEMLSIPRACLRALTHECHEVTTILVHNMLDRARHFTSGDLQNEKMISLGKLSAGLAHELNNPASAIERSAGLLEDRLEEAEAATHALGVGR